MTGNIIDESSFSHKLLSTDKEALRLCKVCTCNFSANIDLSKT